MPETHGKIPPGGMEAEWLREYLTRNGCANICQLMKQQEDPVRWLEQRVAPEFWRRIKGAWANHQERSRPAQPGYMTREISARATTWVLVDAMLKDAMAASPDRARPSAVDMDALLVQLGVQWFGRDEADAILRSALTGMSRPEKPER